MKLYEFTYDYGDGAAWHKNQKGYIITKYPVQVLDVTILLYKYTYTHSDDEIENLKITNSWPLDNDTMIYTGITNEGVFIYD